MPLRDVTLSEVKAWRESLDASTESTNAAAYRLLRSILQAAEEEELIDRAPPKIRGARSGVRTVHVPPPFLPMLQKHLLEHATEGSNGLLFPGDRTDHMSVRYLMDRYRPAREAAGRPDLTIHHLRHTALTLGGQHGATAAELQARAGHASQAAMAIYQHAALDRDKALAEKVGETYADWQAARRSE